MNINEFLQKLEQLNAKREIAHGEFMSVLAERTNSIDTFNVFKDFTSEVRHSKVLEDIELHYEDKVFQTELKLRAVEKDVFDLIDSFLEKGND